MYFCSSLTVKVQENEQNLMHPPIYIYIYIYIWQGSFSLVIVLAQSAGTAQQNTPSSSLQRDKTPPTSVLDMTLNNMKVMLQLNQSSAECGVPLHCHRSQSTRARICWTQSGPIYGSNRTFRHLNFALMFEIELFFIFNSVQTNDWCLSKYLEPFNFLDMLNCLF